MTKEQVSILLEIFSFFFVTLDLYGKERVSRLSKTINNLPKRLWEQRPPIDKLFEVLEGNFLWLLFLLGVSLLVTMFVFVFSIPIILSFPTMWALEAIAVEPITLSFGEQDFPNIVQFWMVIVLLIYFFSPLGDYVVAFMENVGFWFGAIIVLVIRFLQSMSLSILELVDFEGLLLFIGAILFIISKVVVY